MDKTRRHPAGMIDPFRCHLSVNTCGPSRNKKDASGKYRFAPPDRKKDRIPYLQLDGGR
jgi:hypothetical protein